MATFTWYLQGTTPTTIDATDIIQFAGVAGFNSKVAVSEYNDSTHVKTSGGANKSTGNSPRNNKFVSQAGGGGGDSQANWGDGVEDIDQILNAEAALRINFSDAVSVITEDTLFYAYDGTTPTVAPVGVDVRAAEVGDTNFVEIEGSAAALTLDDNTANTSHDFYIVLSASPVSVGLKDDFAFRIELTYS